ncbi:hypothetical protein GCM10009801_24450 [Streptomyces albiaxialis]|uniref:Secreted protein n=1 Tax=Streptomyces albiaxialis TaxID=329523 RepID=A0ABP5HCW2_9ACTN
MSPGPPTPAVSLFWLSATGAPASVVMGPVVSSCTVTCASCASVLSLSNADVDPTLDKVQVKMKPKLVRVLPMDMALLVWTHE